MLSIDTNILLPAVETRNPRHQVAAAFVESLEDRTDVAISEFVLLELYILLRNPAVLQRPFASPVAAGICEAFRQHPRWQLIGFTPDSRILHDRLWKYLREQNFARRRIFDLRMALSMLENGITELATENTKDFEGLGFRRVWNPLTLAAR